METPKIEVTHNPEGVNKLFGKFADGAKAIARKAKKTLDKTGLVKKKTGSIYNPMVPNRAQRRADHAIKCKSVPVGINEKTFKPIYGTQGAKTQSNRSRPHVKCGKRRNDIQPGNTADAMMTALSAGQLPRSWCAIKQPQAKTQRSREDQYGDVLAAEAKRERKALKRRHNLATCLGNNPCLKVATA